MRQLLITGPRQAEWFEADLPPCPADCVVVNALRSAVSVGTELRVYRGIPVDLAGRFLHESVPLAWPAPNGYSLMGEVVEVGSAVRNVVPGHRVFAGAAHQSQAVVPAAQISVLPDGVSLDAAAFLNILEVGHIAIRRGNPAPGSNVAVVGQGIIGLCITAWCRAFGCRVAVVDPDAGRQAIARRLGADLAVSPHDPDQLSELVEFFDGGADVVLEATGRWAAIETALHVARQDAGVVVVSRHTETPAFNPVGHPFLGKRLNLMTSYGYPQDGNRWDRRRSRTLALEMLASGRLSIDAAITDRLPASELPTLYADLDAGRQDRTGIVLDWT